MTNRPENNELVAMIGVINHPFFAIYAVVKNVTGAGDSFVADRDFAHGLQSALIGGQVSLLHGLPKLDKQSTLLRAAS